MTDPIKLHPLLRFASERPFVTAMLGSLCLFLSFAPVGWAPLAWVALVPWILLIATPRFSDEVKKPLRSIWFAGLIFWAAEVYYISIPHPALWAAWIMLFFYLSVYPLLFVWLGRKLRWGQKVPLWLTAALAFTGLEWVRAHMITGFGFSMLANSQYKIPLLIQICDVAGAYGLTFLMTVFAAGVVMLLLRQRVSGIIVSVAAMGIVVGYGSWRMGNINALPSKTLAVVVLQGNIDTRFPATEQEMNEYQKRQFEEYLNLNREWLASRDPAKPMPDLVIWPEGKYPIPDMLPSNNPDHQAFREDFAFFHEELRRSLPRGQTQMPPMIVGALTVKSNPRVPYNSALLLDGLGRIQKRYYKKHLVVFGEFVPFADWLPILKKLTPIGEGFGRGEESVAFRFGDFAAAPNICFESVVCHVIRDSVQQLRSLDEDPDFLLNVTDDGWFYGQAVLDHHLACNVMRAVENRRPMIVAANTGLSAFIEANGKISRQGPRRNSEVMEEQFKLQKADGIFGIVGDWPAVICTIILVFAIIVPAKKPCPAPAGDSKENASDSSSD